MDITVSKTLPKILTAILCATLVVSLSFKSAEANQVVTLPISLDQLIGETVSVGDKLFSDWAITIPSEPGSPPPIFVDISEIEVSALATPELNPGLLFTFGEGAFELNPSLIFPDVYEPH